MRDNRRRGARVKTTGASPRCGAFHAERGFLRRAAAAARAELDIVPFARPFLAPDKRPPAVRAVLGRQVLGVGDVAVGVLGHGEVLPRAYAPPMILGAAFEIDRAASMKGCGTVATISTVKFLVSFVVRPIQSRSVVFDVVTETIPRKVLVSMSWANRASALSESVSRVAGEGSGVLSLGCLVA